MEKCVFDKGEKCVALLTRNCENCSFRKTKEELIAGRRKAKEMLDKLPEEYRKAIIEKYYGRNSVTYEL